MKILLLLVLMAAAVWAQDPFPTRIPDKIAICYENQTISNRFKRMPQSIDSLVAIIRKVEAHPDTALWSIGKMASTLIHRFRYDGIIDVQNAAPGVLPIINEKVESDKFRMQWRLIPGSASDFPESSLTFEEKCSLHWMLSYSVNHTLRIEDRLGGPARMLPSARTTSDDHAEHNEDHSDHANHGQDAQDFDSGSDTADEETDAEPTHDNNDHDNHQEEGSQDENHEDAVDEVVDKETSQEEKNIFNNSEEQNVEEQEPEEVVEEVMEDVVEEENQEEEKPAVEHDHQDGDEDYGMMDDDENQLKRRRRKRQTSPMSANPLELGVVQTKYGVVAVGPVFAGIAAGSEPQSAKLSDIIKDPTLPISDSSMQRTVESIWVATLAGDIGQTALLKTPKLLPSFGPRGKWNSTFCPREYKLDLNDHSLLTNAEFYGGIDGLLMAKRVASWDSSSYMKLSAVLEMYYSPNGIYGDSQYRACNRLNNYKDPAKIDQAILKDQSLNAALIMYSRGIDGAPSFGSNVRPVDKIGEYVNTTMREITNYLGNYNNVEMDFSQCQGEPIVPATEIPATYTDVTFVIDQFNDASEIQKQKELAATLASVLDVQVGGSRMELVASKDGAPFFTLNATQNRADLACMVAGLPIQYSERRIADVLARTRTRIVQERSSDRTNRIGGSNTRSIIFFVSNYVTGSAEKDKIKIELEKMIKETPDVHIMFATLASPEEFRPFVANFDRDILRMDKFAKYSDAAVEIAARLATVGARLSYPSCSDVSNSAASIESQYVFSGFLNPRTIQYFRLGPEHFYTSTALTLRFKSNYGVARYCISTAKELPGTGDTCKNALKADETVEFKLTQPCGKIATNPQSCPSIYASAAYIGIDDNIPCSDKNCHTPDQVKFTFTHEGMRCNGSVGLVVSQLSLLFAVFITYFLNQH